jgi:hypothetical protein
MVRPVFHHRREYGLGRDNGMWRPSMVVILSVRAST